MRRRRAVGLALTLAAVVTLAGCASSPAATNSARDSAQASVANRIDALEPLAFTRADLLPHSPGAERLLDAEGKGEYRIGFAAEDAVVLSDNLAANLLLDHFGGPTAFTDHVQATGDLVTRLDRVEPDLNANIPGDPRDTTSPAAMAKSAAAYIFGDKLDPAYRTMLRDWLVKSETGLARIRAGLPRTWHVGDKTGTCGTAYNDVAFVEEPGGDKYMIGESGGRSLRQPGQGRKEAAATNSLRVVPAPTHFHHFRPSGGLTASNCQHTLRVAAGEDGHEIFCSGRTGHGGHAWHGGGADLDGV